MLCQCCDSDTVDACCCVGDSTLQRRCTDGTAMSIGGLVLCGCQTGLELVRSQELNKPRIAAQRDLGYRIGKFGNSDIWMMN